MSATLLSMPAHNDQRDPARECMRVVIRDAAADFFKDAFILHWDRHPELTVVQAFETFPRWQVLEAFVDCVTAEFYGS